MVNQSLFQKKVLDALSPYKLTAGQPKVLDYLGKHNGCIQKSIATGCQIEPATLTGILSRMEEKKLIIRQTKDGNKDRKSTRLNSSHPPESRMPSSA